MGVDLLRKEEFNFLFSQKIIPGTTVWWPTEEEVDRQGQIFNVKNYL